MRKVSVCFMIVLAILFVATGCQLSNPVQPETVTVGTGLEVSYDEYLELKSIEPQAIAIADRLFGTEATRSLSSEGRTVNVPLDKLDQFKAEMTELLKSKFGEDYKKYIIEGEYGKVEEQIGGTNKESAARAFEINDGADPAYSYYLICAAKWITTGFATWNYNETSHLKVVIGDGTKRADDVLQIRAYISDDATSWVSNTASQNSFVSMTGNTRWFGNLPTCKTGHEVWDPNIWNQYMYREYYWQR